MLEHSTTRKQSLHSEALEAFGQALPPLRATPSWKVQEISTIEQLERLSAKLAKESLLSVDTETGGIGDEAINRRLALVQIGVPKLDSKGRYNGQGKTYLIDVVALEKQADDLMRLSDGHVNPLASLKPILEDETILKIVQAGYFEQGQFWKYQIILQGTDDTKVMAQELRPSLRARGSQAGFGLGSLAVELIGQTVDKGEQDSKWLVRPLTKSQLDYAALDPEVTYEVWRALEQVRERVAINPSWDLEALVHEYQVEITRQQSLIRPVAERIFLLEDRNQQRLERIRSVLLDRANGLEKPLGELSEDELPAVEHPRFGSARVRFRDERTEDIQKLFELDPKVAREVVYETTTRKNLEAAFVQKGFTPAGARKVCDELYEQVGLTEPSLKLEIDLDQVYRQTSGLKPLLDNWKEIQLPLDQIAERIARSPMVSLSAEKEGEERTIQIGIPRVQKGKITRGAGAVVEVCERELAALRDSHPEQFAEFQEALRSKTVVSFQPEKESSWLTNYDLSPAGFVSLPVKAERFRPDLPSDSAQVILAEYCKTVFTEKTPTAIAKGALTVALEIERREELARIESHSSRLSWEKQIERDLNDILVDRAEKMALLRSIGEEYDVARVRSAKLLERMTEELVSRKEQKAQTKVRIEGEWGAASLSQRAVKELNVARLKEQYPDVADIALSETINRNLLEERWKAEVQPQIFQKNWDKVFPPTRVGLLPSAAPKYGAIHQAYSGESSQAEREAA